MLVSLSLALLQETAKPEEPAAFGPLEVGIAADVLGAHFSEKELELMLPDVLERLKEFEKLRAVPLGNDVAPALLFAPDPEKLGKTATFVREEPLYSGPPPSTEPDSLAYLPIWALEESLRTRRISCVDLTRTFIERLKRLDEKLHCVVTLTEERALAQARKLDEENGAGKRRGPLHGVPWVAKDLLAVKGYPTTWGTPPYKAQSIDLDAAVVEKLDAAGAVLIAKVSLG